MGTQAGDVERRILDVLVAHAVIPHHDGWELLPASGGYNTSVYFARRHGARPSLTLRLSGDAPDLLRREAEVLTAVEQHDACAPRVVALIADPCLAGELLLAHTWVAGSTMPLAEVPDVRLRSLGECLARIHAVQRDYYEIWPHLEPKSGTRAQAFRDRLAAVARYATFSAVLHDDVAPIYRALESLPLPDDAGWQETTFSLLQGDLSVGNIVWDDDSVALIDWEFARYGDPAEELAYVFAEQPLPEPAVNTLLDSYVASGGDPSAVARTPTWAPLASLDSVLWWGDYHLTRDSDPASSAEVQFHLDRARKALERLGTRLT